MDIEERKKDPEMPIDEGERVLCGGVYCHRKGRILNSEELEATRNFAKTARFIHTDYAIKVISNLLTTLEHSNLNLKVARKLLTEMNKSGDTGYYNAPYQQAVKEFLEKTQAL